MKVLLIAENWPPRQGGIENYLINIATHLPTGSVRVVAPRTKVKSPESTGPGVATTRPRFFYPFIRPAWLPLFIWLWRRLKRQHVDVILCGKALFEGIPTYYLKKHLGIPYVVLTYAMEVATWEAHRGTRRQLQRVVRAADRVVYINEVTKHNLLSLGVSQSQLVKIWPGVSPQFLERPSAEKIKAKATQYNLYFPYILCVGRLIPRKGINLLIESFAALDQTRFADVHLVIVGAGPELTNLQKNAEQNYVGPRVHFLTHVPTADLPALYAGCLFFALTPQEIAGDFEGFGIVYLEAGAQGKATLGTRTGGVPEAVLDQQTGLLVTPTTEDIAGALTTLLEDKLLRDQLGDNARARVVKEFDWSKRIVLIKGMLDAILHRTPNYNDPISRINPFLTPGV